MRGHANCILSTCGTSLLTNGRTDQERRLVGRYANYGKRAQAQSQSAQDVQHLDQIIAAVRDQMQNATPAVARRLSAELNGLLTFYGTQPIPPADQHLLLCTDTWLGECAAQIVADWLRRQGGQAQVIRQRDLQTDHLESFQLALAELVKWCEETLPGYQQANYRIVFNLTGGFKSVQGFMQTLALFYADETVYIFESGAALLRIPRLPVRMAATDEIRAHLRAFRRLSRDLPVTPQELRGIPETLWMQVDDRCALSPWGELVWQQAKREIYAERLYPPPSDRMRFGPKFEESVRGLPPDRLRLVNERLDDLAAYLERGDNRNRLDFKPLRGKPRPPSTHECDAWADQDARRIFGHYEGEVFVLDRLDKALH
ncbi:putative CRISPR-associated protein [Kallotenue papyrolyticum]|uniref:putative CRISPR-associated protein n=1 Tax=Kallotenue papyrolyticum TaxID=1325125 RepID=UPI0004922864|nr:putative CRISPR-associated protein [Kallotenue papyrolyticum]